MGNIFSSYFSPSPCNNLVSSSLTSTQLIHRHTLSTCYDSIFDVSLSSKSNSILTSDDGKLRLFKIDVENNCQLIEMTNTTTRLSLYEQVHDIVWSTKLDQYLILTSKRLITYDSENNFINLNLELEKNSPPFWRMACCSNNLIVNLGLGTSIRYHDLISSSCVPLIHSWTRSSLGYNETDLLSTIALSPQLILAINVELTNNRHVIDLFSIREKSKFEHLKRINSNEPCPLDVITSLRDCTWLCKSHWPSNDCLCIIESDGNVKKLDLQEQNGYVLNLRLLADCSHVIIIRTANKLPKEIEDTKLDSIEQNEQEQHTHVGRRKQVIGKLPGNLLLEIYKTSWNIKK